MNHWTDHRPVFLIRESQMRSALVTESKYAGVKTSVFLDDFEHIEKG